MGGILDPAKIFVSGITVINSSFIYLLGGPYAVHAPPGFNTLERTLYFVYLRSAAGQDFHSVTSRLKITKEI
jgi:hypothetical protein